MPVAPEHGGAWEEEGGDVGGEGPHDQSQGGFVGGAKEDRPVEVSEAEQFIHTRRAQVAIEHEGRFRDGFRQKKSGGFEAHATCL